MSRLDDHSAAGAVADPGHPVVMLIDNGSRRPDATLNLRRLASELSARTGLSIHPVSLQHADRVPASALGGQPASTFTPFVEQCLRDGHRRFVALPLFFGPSRALTSFIPQQLEPLQARHPDLQLLQADVLCPLPPGEPRLADILADNVQRTERPATRVIVVDHGSPIPEVTAVRRWLTEALRERLPSAVDVDEAVMERRAGRDYDFNGQLLEERLDGATGEVVLAMLFLSPGRHAGAGGDIAEICTAAEAANPGLKVTPTALVGEHPGLVEILQRRLDAVLGGAPVTA
jgi:sirohydrochlorin ferrochelatase